MPIRSSPVSNFSLKLLLSQNWPVNFVLFGLALPWLIFHWEAIFTIIVWQLFSILHDASQGGY